MLVNFIYDGDFYCITRLQSAVLATAIRYFRPSVHP